MQIIGCKILCEETHWENSHKDSKKLLKCKILGFHCGEDLGCDLLCCSARQAGR
jgi:hypothetical protein